MRILRHLPDDDDELSPPAADLAATPVERADSTSWPATRFSVDPASSPVLMAAFAWSSVRAADVRCTG